jgi:protein-disulfide isomerase
MRSKILIGGVAVLAVVVGFMGGAPSLHNISYAIFKTILRPVSACAADASNDQLAAALQKRLLVPDPAMLTIGPPSPGPLSGMSQRNITVSIGQGQKAELKYFTTGNSADKGILTREYISFDTANPWQRVDVSKLHLKDRGVLGPANAPVTIIEFADFECPYCARAYSEIETLVNTTYKDKVRLIWKNFPLPAHTWAQQAAIAAECAREQNPDALWVFARNFYRDQGDITAQNLRQHIDQYATATGLDGKALNACVLGDAAEKQVLADRADGEQVHLNSTPTFLINGVMVVGLPSSNVFDFVIASQLKEKSASR